MSSVPTTSPSSASFSAQIRDRRLPDWMREPLLHFVILGGLLFAIDRIATGNAEDPNTIVVGADVDAQAIEVFKSARQRNPSQDELAALHRVWLDNEVLYREGLALQVDKGDSAIRERVIFKALSVIDANVKLPPIDDRQLRDWFEQRRARYDEPARYDFEEAVLAGESSEAALRAFVDALNRDDPGEAKAGLRVFKGRPLSNIEQSYGTDFPKTLATLREGEWSAVRTRDTWRAIRLTGRKAPQPAVFESLRGVVLQDWKDAIAAEQRTAAVRALAQKYTVKYELPSAEGSK